MRSISVLGSDEQVAKWIPLATKHQLIGSYAQTELGHGKATGRSQCFCRVKGSGPDSQGSRVQVVTEGGWLRKKMTPLLPQQAGDALFGFRHCEKNNKS